MNKKCETKPMVQYDNWHFKMILDEEHVPVFEGVMDEIADALLASLIEQGENTGKWLFEAIFEKRPDMGQLDLVLEIGAGSLGIEVPNYTIGALPKKNWLKDSLISFPPVTIGDFYIYGSHIKDEPPKDKTSIKIDAATAFGSGEHPTTEGCLNAIQMLKKTWKKSGKILDMGSGSGILSIAAAKVLGSKVYAVDIDEEAARVTQENADMNGVGDLVEAKKGAGYRSGFVRMNGPYDLILSNILAKPLIRMAPSAHKYLKVGGAVVLSGLLQRQEKWVVTAYEKQGFEVEKTYHIGEWSAVVCRKVK